MLNYGEASRVLYITQPTLTSQIKSLEEVFGTKLFDRDSRYVSLTPAGAVLVDHARTILRQIKEAHHDIHVGKPQWRARLACGDAAQVSLLPRLLRSLAQSHPAFIVEISEVGPEDHLAALLEGRVDAILMEGPFETPEANFEQIACEPVVAAVPRTFPMANLSTVSLKELSQYPILLPAQSSISDSLSAQGLQAKYIFAGRSVFSQLAEVNAGRAIALCPQTFSLVRRPGVRFLGLREKLTPIVLGLTTRYGDDSSSTEILRTSLMAVTLSTRQSTYRS
jgi:DNA-binding transcriptional LysR family regulator